jgi:hypothetical protein
MFRVRGLTSNYLVGLRPRLDLELCVSLKTSNRLEVLVCYLISRSSIEKMSVEFGGIGPIVFAP